MPDKKPAAAIDAIDLLKADHREVEALFAKFEKAPDDAKVELASEICQALSVHAALEERVFYPASRDAMDADGESLVDEAEVEHGSLKDLMRKLRGRNALSAHFDALVTVLKEYVKHHVEEEESEFFPKVRRLGLDTVALGAQMQTAKALPHPTARSRSNRRLCARAVRRGGGERRTSPGRPAPAPHHAAERAPGPIHAGLAPTRSSVELSKADDQDDATGGHAGTHRSGPGRLAS